MNTLFEKASQSADKYTPAWFKEAERHANFSVFIGPEDVAEISWGTAGGGLINKARVQGPCMATED